MPANTLLAAERPGFSLSTPSTNYQLAMQRHDLRAALQIASALPALLTLPDAYGFTTLMLAALDGDTDCVREVLRLSAGMLGGCRSVVFQQSPFGTTPLMIAAGCGHVDTMNVLLAALTEPERTYLIQMVNRQGGTALTIAAWPGHADAITALMAGLPAPARSALACMRDWHGRTALMAAAQTGHAGAISVLLAGVPESERAGLAQMANAQGWAALMHAAWFSQAETVSALLTGVPNPEAMLQMRTAQGMNVLMLAAGFGQAEVMKVLLDAVEDKDAFAQQAHHGVTALRLAVINHRMGAVVALLESAENPFALLAQAGPDNLTPMQLAGRMSAAYLSAIRRALGQQGVGRM